MQYAFRAGKTNLFAGLEEAARIAHPWPPKSASLVLLSDGDTVPATGMPKMPASIARVLVVGVGDPRAGKFIDGHQSRQDASTLRQIAVRLRGVYHDGNQQHVSTETLADLTAARGRSKTSRWTRREYALLAIGAGGGEPQRPPVAGTAHGLDHRVDAVTVALGVGQALDGHARHPLAQGDTVGGGVEWAFGGNWSAKIEGTYMDFGQKNRSFAGIPVLGLVTLPVNADIESHITTVKFGVNYRFGTYGKTPVAARY